VCVMGTAVPVGVGQEGVTGIPDSVPLDPESVEPEAPPPPSVWAEPGPPPESFEPEPPPEPPEASLPVFGPPPFATLVSAPPPSLCGDPLPDESAFPEPQPETASMATRRHPVSAWTVELRGRASLMPICTFASPDQLSVWV